MFLRCTEEWFFKVSWFGWKLRQIQAVMLIFAPVLFSTLSLTLFTPKILLNLQCKSNPPSSMKHSFFILAAMMVTSNDCTDFRKVWDSISFSVKLGGWILGHFQGNFQIILFRNSNTTYNLAYIIFTSMCYFIWVLSPPTRLYAFLNAETLSWLLW